MAGTRGFPQELIATEGEQGSEQEIRRSKKERQTDKMQKEASTIDKTRVSEKKKR